MIAKSKVDGLLNRLEENMQETKSTKKEIKLFEKFLEIDFAKDFAKDFVDKFTEVKKDIKKRYKRGTSINKLRKELAAVDLNYFALVYLPHYFKRESAKFHKELDLLWSENVIKNKNVFKEAEAISQLQGKRLVITAPRGHAKSTTFTFKNTLHAILYGYKKYIMIISDSSEQAESFLSDISSELEDNQLIKKDFGEQVGKTWNTSTLITSKDIKIDAIGSGKKIRGRRHKNFRPDLIVLDDIENDENVNTLEQRKKLENWYYKAVSKAGDTPTDICYIGTLLHYDSLLAKVMENAGYTARKYQGVIQFSNKKGLWEEWEKIYNNLEEEKREENARVFFEFHKKEMLENTKVLWEEKADYYNLMITRLTEGVTSFNSEIQNEPIDPNSCLFNKEWFDFYNEVEVNFSSKDYLFFGAIDPSLGKNKKSDTSAIVVLAKNIVNGYLYVVEASIERRTPDTIITDTIEMHKRLMKEYKKGFCKLGVETVQFQSFFKDILTKECLKENLYLNIEEIKSTTNKVARIESLQPYIKNKYLKFNARHKNLLEQLEYFPFGRYDDGADALEMATKLAINSSNSVKIEYKSIFKNRINFKKGAY